jgi:hypothetical protein
MKVAWAEMFEPGHVRASLRDCVGAYRRRALTAIANVLYVLYVAMTRAKDSLHLVMPQRFFVHGRHAQGDRHLYASRTRFIPRSCSVCSSARRGRLRRPVPRHAPPAKDPRWILAPVCRRMWQ